MAGRFYTSDSRESAPITTDLVQEGRNQSVVLSSKFLTQLRNRMRFLRSTALRLAFFLQKPFYDVNFIIRQTRRVHAVAYHLGHCLAVQKLPEALSFLGRKLRGRQKNK